MLFVWTGEYVWDGVVYVQCSQKKKKKVSKSLKEMHEGCQFLLSVPKVQLY